MTSENETLLHLAALSGMGLVFLPSTMVEADVEAGRLELLLPDAAQFSSTRHTVYASPKYLSAKVRSFIDFLSAEAA